MTFPQKQKSIRQQQDEQDLRSNRRKQRPGKGLHPPVGVAVSASVAWHSLDRSCVLCPSGFPFFNANKITEPASIFLHRDDTKKVYMAARTSEKAQAAIDDLVNNAGVSADKLAYLHFDPNEGKKDIQQKTVRALSEKTVYGLILNAGGMGKGNTTEPNKVTEMAQINLIGHVHLVDALLAAKKIGTESRIVYAGSEAARGLPTFGMSRPKLEEMSQQDFADILSGDKYKDSFQPDAAYAEMKGMAALYFGRFAREHKNLYAVTVSPGATKGTEVLSQEGLSAFQVAIFKVMFTVFGWFGAVHELEVGAKRYVDAVTGFDYPSGSFVASAKGASGPLVDQASLDSGIAFGQTETQDKAYDAIRAYA